MGSMCRGERGSLTALLPPAKRKYFVLAPHAGIDVDRCYDPRDDFLDFFCRSLLDTR